MATFRIHSNGVLIRRRTRSPLVLPNFVGGDELGSEGARFDKLVLSRVFLLSAVPFDYDGPAELARRVKEDQSHIATNQGEGLSVSSSALQLALRGNGEASLSLGDSAVGHDVRWLIGLSIIFKSTSIGSPHDTDAARPPVRLHVRLSLNPSRILAHAYARGISLSSLSWEQALTSDAATYARVASLSVSGRQDNVLPISDYLQPRSIDRLTSTVADLVGLVDRFIEHLMGVPLREERPAGGAWFAPTAMGWSLVQAETYWEFGQIDAISFVRRLRPTLWSIAGDMAERSWSLEDGCEAVAYTMRATRDIRIALYAKTIDRIRLEVRHVDRVPGSTRDSLEHRLGLVAEDSAVRANRARIEILRRRERAEENVSLSESVDILCDLVLILSSAYPGNAERATDILRTLLTRGGLRVSGHQYAVSRQEAQNLKRLQVVQSSGLAMPSRGENFYPLAIRFQPLFEGFVGVSAARDR